MSAAASLFPEMYPCTCARPGRLGCERHGPAPREHASPCRGCMRMTWAADALCDDCWAKAHPLRPALSADWDDESTCGTALEP
jgi:hypothetical protein